MLNQKSINAVDQAQFSTSFCRPLYDSYCFSRIPNTLLSLFGGSESGLPSETCTSEIFDQVVFLFIDGFGYRFFEAFQEHPLLQRFAKEGIVSKLTSLFPSTTAAHITCINSGLTPGISGIYEWFIHEPEMAEIIAPLPFSLAGDRKPDSLELDPNRLYPSTTLYQTLAQRGIDSRVALPEKIADSVCSQHLSRGANIQSYTSEENALKDLFGSVQPKTYSYFYYGEIDAIGHRRGISSTEFAKTVEGIFATIEKALVHLPKNTALILTADHGMVDVSPTQTLYLNQIVPDIEKYLLFSGKNRPLAPAGSCRDFFLHVLPEYRRELKEILDIYLNNIAEVYDTRDLIDEGLFAKVTKRLSQRIGDLVILPYEGEAVWWYEKGRFEQNFYGAHGGLTRGEMEIPFLFLSL